MNHHTSESNNTVIVDLLHRMKQLAASDLYLSEDKVPYVRVVGQIQSVAHSAPLLHEDFTDFITEYLPAGTQDRIQSDKDLDIGVSLNDEKRYRLNVYFEKGKLGMAVRLVPLGNLSFESLGLPDTLRTLAEKPRGLILVVGATGSGKSTTLAAMINHINEAMSKHIITIEDPIEFLHQDRTSVISQREVGTDTRSFLTALRHVVRQDPDVILLGEMRDRETIETAISAALTGHTVISSLHTVDVSQTLERLINYFPGEQRDQLAHDFALALSGIVAQRLVPTENGKGRLPVCEILMATPMVRKLIAKRSLADIDEILKSGTSDGMQTFTRALVNRVKAKQVTVEDAMINATNRDEFMLAIQGMETGIDTLRSQELQDALDSPDVRMSRLLHATVKFNASDLLLTVGSPPTVRIAGDLKELDIPPLTANDTQRLLFSILTPSQRAYFESEREIDFALSIKDSKLETMEAGNRFRVNGFYQKGSVAASFRVVPQELPNAERLMIPSVVLNQADRHQGLLLVTGPTGHGKTTTLACLIDRINASRNCHIITIEDPIELVHENKKSIIEQREVGADTHSFERALKYVLRQDPDVILIGEMRDRETISAALTAAETGHLVLATLHTNDTAQTVDRIIDTFPGMQQSQVRSQLAASLLAIVAQRLVPKRDDSAERVAAFEVLLATNAVRAIIRENKTHQMQSTMETNAKEGMITLDRSLINLYNRGFISRQTFKAVAKNPTLV